LLALLGAAWITFTACEMSHTLADFANDRRAGYRTFARRVGFERAWRLERILLMVGTTAWVWAAMRLLPPAGAAVGGAVLVALGVLVPVLAVAADVRGDPAGLMLPYGAVKRGWGMLAILLLGLPPAETVLLLWLCSTIKLG
jgi:hypothetical protein